MWDSWIKLVGCGIIKCKCVRNEINKLILKNCFWFTWNSNSGHLGVGYLTSQLLYEVEK